MSFSNDVKNECARVEVKNECCRLTETAAFLRCAGKLLMGGKQAIGISVISGNAAIVRRIFAFLKLAAPCDARIIAIKGSKLQKSNRYELRVDPAESNLGLLSRLGMWNNKGFILKDYFLKDMAAKSCCRRALQRGFFLGGGSLSSPKRDYHLEISAPNFDYGVLLQKSMRKFGLTSRMIERKDSLIIYLKEAESIIDFLRIIEANNSVLQYENVRVVKEMRNRINREVNCETANLNKTICASNRQIEKIRIIARVKGLDSLPTALRVTAEARYNNPEASISELMEIIGDDVSKSGINHRLRKIECIADELTEEESD